MTTFTAVAPMSVRTWYAAFAEPDAPVAFIGEEPGNAAEIAAQISSEAQDRPIRILSGHESFLRDVAAARQLSAEGFSVRVQTPRAVRAATDKIYMKQVLVHHSVPTPMWGVRAPGHVPPDTLLCKARNSTQSNGIAWASMEHEWPSDCYWEEYVDGVEYSVVLYREGRTTTLLPPVWKGAVQRDLLPPWRRLRVCPAPEVQPGTLDKLARFSRIVAEALDIWGFGEVEFVVDNTGEPYVLEVNPRISGTLRIAAMAASIPVFNPYAFAGQPDELPATCYAAEVPYDGPPIVAHDVIATSRITCRADSEQAVKAAMERYLPVSTTALNWPPSWSVV